MVIADTGLRSSRTLSNPRRELKSSHIQRNESYLFPAIDAERKKIIHLKVYPARNAFLKVVLRMCEVEEVILDKGSWYMLCNA